MRRDLDLVRELLLRLEGLDLRPGSLVSFTSADEEVAIPERTADEIDGHLHMIYDAGLVVGSDDGRNQMLSGGWLFRRLSPAGHDFVDTFRDVGTLKKAKDIGKQAGGWSLDVLLDVGKALVKEGVKAQLAKHGIPFI